MNSVDMEVLHCASQMECGPKQQHWIGFYVVTTMWLPLVESSFHSNRFLSIEVDCNNNDIGRHRLKNLIAQYVYQKVDVIYKSTKMTVF